VNLQPLTDDELPKERTLAFVTTPLKELDPVKGFNIYDIRQAAEAQRLKSEQELAKLEARCAELEKSLEGIIDDFDDPDCCGTPTMARINRGRKALETKHEQG
jgi:hypothetical protein